MSLTIDSLRNFAQKSIASDDDCHSLLNTLLPLLDQVVNYNEVSQLGLEIFTKNKDNECLKKHLLDPVFSGEDFNVLHYAFCRKLYQNNIMITIQDVHQKLEQILAGLNENKFKPPIGPDFKCIILATPLIFFPNEIEKAYNDDYKKYCSEINNILRNSPKIKRLNPKWPTPLNIRNDLYGLMGGNNTFDPDNLEKVIEVAGDPNEIPQVKIY